MFNFGKVFATYLYYLGWGLVWFLKQSKKIGLIELYAGFILHISIEAFHCTLSSLDFSQVFFITDLNFSLSSLSWVSLQSLVSSSSSVLYAYGLHVLSLSLSKQISCKLVLTLKGFFDFPIWVSFRATVVSSICFYSTLSSWISREVLYGSFQNLRHLLFRLFIL